MERNANIFILNKKKTLRRRLSNFFFNFGGFCKNGEKCKYIHSAQIKVIPKTPEFQNKMKNEEKEDFSGKNQKQTEKTKGNNLFKIRHFTMKKMVSTEEKMTAEEDVTPKTPFVIISIFKIILIFENFSKIL